MDDDIWKPLSTIDIEYDLKLLKNTFCNNNINQNINIPNDSPFYLQENQDIIQLNNDINNINSNYQILKECQNKINKVINHSNEILSTIKSTPNAELLNACLKLVSKEPVDQQDFIKLKFTKLTGLPIMNSSHAEESISNLSRPSSLIASPIYSLETPNLQAVKEKTPILSSIQLESDIAEEIEINDGWGDSLEELDIL